MRILALVTDAFGGYGGIARYNCDFLEALAAVSPAHEVRVLARIGEDRPFAVGANLHQDRPVHARVPFALRAIRKTLAWRPDVIYCGHVFHGPLALLLARLSGTMLVSQLHGTEVWQPLGRIHLTPLRKSDMVLCVSRDTRARYARQAGSADNAFVLANTVAPAFTPGDRARARARLDLGEAQALLTVSRLDNRDGYKGHDRVIAALPGLHTPDGRPVIYLIAGTGPDGPRLARMADDLGVTDRVRFLGKVPEEDLPDLYRAADLFVLPSIGEGFGIVYLEAMASGTPVLGLTVGGVPDPLSDGELGTLLGPDDDIHHALTALLGREKPDPLELASKVQNRFGIASFRTRVKEACERLLVTNSVPGGLGSIN